MTPLRLDELVHERELPSGGAHALERAIEVRDDAGLKLEEARAQLGAMRLGLGDRALVAIENRELRGQAERPLVLALVVFVSGAEVNVGILLRDLELQCGLRRGIFGERGQDIG